MNLWLFYTLECAFPLQNSITKANCDILKIFKTKNSNREFDNREFLRIPWNCLDILEKFSSVNYNEESVEISGSRKLHKIVIKPSLFENVSKCTLHIRQGEFKCRPQFI